ncbi:MAG: hypothetical protein ACAI38_10600 [Myxococcota bacterium]
MNLRAAIAPMAFLLVFSGFSDARAAGVFAFEGLPGLAETQHLEAVLLIEDLRELRAKMELQRNLVARTAFGRDYLKAEHQRAMLGVDMYGEIDRLLALAAPKGAKVPVVAAVLSEGEGVMHGQLAIKVEDGAIERFAKAPNESAITFTNDNGALKVTMYGATLPAKVDGGWLRIGSTDAALALAGTKTLTALPDAITRWTKDSHVVLAVLGGGVVSAGLNKAFADNPMAQNLVSEARAIAMTVRIDDDLSQVARVVFDSEAVKQMAPMIKGQAKTTSAAATWDAEALTAVSIAVPPMLLTGALTIAQMQMPEIADPSVQEVIKAAQAVDGRLSLATFGAPGDWAIAADFIDAAAAQTFVNSGANALKTVLDRYAVEPGLMRVEGKSGSEVVKLRPDVTLPDTTVAALGNSVVAARQRVRIERLSDLRNAKKGKSLLDGPLTPAIREVLARPSILQAYVVTGYDGTTLEWFYWPAKMAEVTLKQMRDLIPKDALDPNLYGAAFANPASMTMSRLPLTLAVAGFGLASVYDYAVALDVDDSAVVLQLAGSQL